VAAEHPPSSGPRDFHEKYIQSLIQRNCQVFRSFFFLWFHFFLFLILLQMQRTHGKTHVVSLQFLTSVAQDAVSDHAGIQKTHAVVQAGVGIVFQQDVSLTLNPVVVKTIVKGGSAERDGTVQ
jgi:hypothetical protein